MSTLGISTRKLAAFLLAAGLVMAPGAAADATPRTADRGGSLPQRIELPDGFQPEGITVRGGPVAYLGSRADGDIYAVNARTGKVVAHYDFTSETSFVNDVILRGKSAWFTDSRRAVLYQVTPKHGRADGATVRTLPLSGDWEQIPDVNNANGITTTPDGRALLVVQSATGYLFRVNPRTGHAARVDLGTTLLTNGDGLLRKGRLLYAAQNRDNKVAVVRLGKHSRVGHLVRTLTSPDFDIPTTIASYRGGLYLPNARFSTPPTPTTDYWITRIAKR